MANKAYKPNPTPARMHESDARVKVLLAPYAAGITTALLHDAMHADRLTNGGKWLYLTNGRAAETRAAAGAWGIADRFEIKSTINMAGAPRVEDVLPGAEGVVVDGHFRIFKDLFQTYEGPIVAGGQPEGFKSFMPFEGLEDGVNVFTAPPAYEIRDGKPVQVDGAENTDILPDTFGDGYYTQTSDGEWSGDGYEMPTFKPAPVTAATSNVFRQVRRPLTDLEKDNMGEIKRAAAVLYDTIRASVPDGRERSKALTDLEQSVMWAIKGLTK